MTLDEAIKHAEEVTEKNEKKAKSYPRPDKNVKGSGRKYNDCIECASEHRQLAEWLKELKQLRKQRTGEWRKMSDLPEDEDDRYQCSRCDNVIHYLSKENLYTFNRWCGRCGSDNDRRQVE